MHDGDPSSSRGIGEAPAFQARETWVAVPLKMGAFPDGMRSRRPSGFLDISGKPATRASGLSYGTGDRVVAVRRLRVVNMDTLTKRRRRPDETPSGAFRQLVHRAALATKG